MQLKHLARALGISPSMCSRLVKRGMPADSLERAQRWRGRHLDLARTKAARLNIGMAGDNVAAGAEPPRALRAGDDAPEQDGSSAEYRFARAEREQLRVARERIELEQLKGNLIDAQEAADFEFTAGRITRDRMEQVAPRLAAEIHALVLSLVPEKLRPGVAKELDVGVVESRMADAIRRGLSEAAAAIRGTKDDDDDD